MLDPGHPGLGVDAARDRIALHALAHGQRAARVVVCHPDWASLVARTARGRRLVALWIGVFARRLAQLGRRSRRALKDEAGLADLAALGGEALLRFAVDVHVLDGRIFRTQSRDGERQTQHEQVAATVHESCTQVKDYWCLLIDTTLK